MHVHVSYRFHILHTESARNQERLWEETIHDDVATEIDSRRGGGGGETAQKLNPQLMHNIQVIVNRLVSKAGQLIHNLTTNLTEKWMHIRCKFDGGKVVNRIQSGSWESHCYGAGLEKNLGKTWGPQICEKVTGSSANQVFINSTESTARKLENDRKWKATDEAKAS